MNQLSDPRPVDAHSVMYITKRPDIIMMEGKGSWLVDQNGKRYLDFLQGWAVNCLGHCNPGIISALYVQSQKLINPSPAFYNEPMIRLSDLLTSHSCFNKVFFANSGAKDHRTLV
ncbi:MAG: aminotransferase class III-fold pyridoxal phosphate-dependent enzyme, partial [Burkholderiaceae bacterium]|nr:aminotransferase class III-fold pyridoxal phosphate-dependent enzyme [Burkholderiaceae bacterium]